MPIYDLSAVAQALDFDTKRLDNLLSRNALEGIEKKRRGVTRRLTPDIVVVIRLAKELAEAFGLPPGSLLRFASNIMRENRGRISLGELATIEIDIGALRTSTLSRLDSAVEVVGRRRRGRPPKRRSPGEHAQ